MSSYVGGSACWSGPRSGVRAGSKTKSGVADESRKTLPFEISFFLMIPVAWSEISLPAIDNLLVKYIFSDLIMLIVFYFFNQY